MGDSIYVMCKGHIRYMWKNSSCLSTDGVSSFSVNVQTRRWVRDGIVPSWPNPTGDAELSPPALEIACYPTRWGTNTTHARTRNHHGAVPPNEVDWDEASVFYYFIQFSDRFMRWKLWTYENIEIIEIATETDALEPALCLQMNQRNSSIKHFRDVDFVNDILFRGWRYGEWMGNNMTILEIFRDRIWITKRWSFKPCDHLHTDRTTQDLKT